jgi:hypothetical protein
MLCEHEQGQGHEDGHDTEMDIKTDTGQSSCAAVSDSADTDLAVSETELMLT